MALTNQFQFYNQILEQIGDAVIAIDNNFCVTYCNQVTLRQYKLEEAIGKPLRECYEYKWLQPEDEEIAATALETYGSWHGENIHCRLDGSEIYVESKVTVLRDKSGNSMGYLATIRDISDRKELETKIEQTELALQQSEDRYRQIVQTQVDFLLQSLPDTTITFANDSLCRALGCTLEQVIGQKWIDFANPDDLQTTLQKITLLSPLNPTFVGENPDLRADGKIGWTQWINQGIFNELGELTLIQSVGRDITELKNAEATLRVSEANSKSILSAIPDLMFRVSKNGLIYCDFSSRGIVGSIIPDDIEIIGKSMSDLLPELVCRRHAYYLDKALETAELQIYTQTVQIGDRVQEEEVRAIACNEEEVLFIVRDITEQKRMERALQASETKLRAILTAIPDLMLRIGIDGRFLECINNRHLCVVDQNIEIENQSTFDLLPQEISSRSYLYLQEVIATGEPKVFEHRIKNGDRWQDEEVRVVKSGADEVLYLIRNISDRKELQKQLTDSEAKLNDILNSVRSAVTRWIVAKDGSWEIDYRSNGCEAICGYSAKELMTDKGLWLSLVDLEHYQTLESQFFADIFASREGTYTYRLLHRDGTWRWISQKNTSRWDINLNAWVVTMISADITDRKRIEIDLQTSQAALLEAQAIAHIGSWEFDIPSQKITWSPELFRIFGLDPNQPEPTYAEYLRLIHPEDSIRLHQCVEHAIAHGTPYQVDYRPILTDGSMRYHEGKGQIERDERGQIKRLFGTALDITDRINAQIALEELNRELENKVKKRTVSLQKINKSLAASEDKFRRFFDLAPIGIAVIDVQTHQFTATNKAFCKLLGYSEAELLESLTSQSISVPEDWETGRVYLEALLNGEDSYFKLHKRYIKKDGEIILGNLTATYITDYDGNITHLMGMVEDITERKKAEEDLIASHNKVRESQSIQRKLFKQVKKELFEKEKLYEQLYIELLQKKVLLKEVHHRVKNNLQIISSILFLQFGSFESENLSLVVDFQNRIYAIAKIHDQLYRSDDLSEVKLLDYITNLTSDLLQSFGTNSYAIELVIDIDKISVPLEQSIPLGLIVNELVTNCLKHAFPEKQGKIYLQVIKTDLNLLLTVSDNGMGLHGNFDIENSGKLGLQLVKSLTEQLKGELFWNGENGLTVQISFPQLTLQVTTSN